MARQQGFSYKSIVRELDAQLLSTVLAFFDSASHALLSRRTYRYPLRLPEPSPDIEQRLLDFERISDAMAEQRKVGFAAQQVENVEEVSRVGEAGVFRP